jgi:hypothetical protein
MHDDAHCSQERLFVSVALKVSVIPIGTRQNKC